MIKPTRNHSVNFYTLGCRLNQSETAVLENDFEARHFTIRKKNEPADIAVINTCTVTENGDTDTRRLINRIIRMNPSTRIALVGCQAQVQRKALTGLPNVKWVIGNEVKMQAAGLISLNPDPREPRVITPPIGRQPFSHPVAGIDRLHTRANLKIQDGCDFFCSFCEIPYARGRARSRRFPDILKEARILAEHGHKELVLTGINVGTYHNGNKGLFDVIEALETIPALERVRISSIEPTTVDERIVNHMINGKVCRHLHIPLQSASDGVLKRMQRKYTLSQFDRFIQKVHLRVPGLCIGTDVIVGFPGETEDDLKTTYAYLRDAPVDYFHVFSYSERSMNRSRRLTGSVDKNTIAQRSRRLRSLSRRKREIFYREHLQSCQDVLFEQKKHGLFSGLTDNYIRVMMDSDKELSNTLVEVHLDRINDNAVIGREGIS